MSKLVIKMVYNPNVSHYSQAQSPNFSSNHQLKITKVKFLEQNETASSAFDPAFWQDDHEDLNLPKVLTGCVFFVVGLMLFTCCLFLRESNEGLIRYREIFILLTLWGLIILDPKLGSNHNDKTSLGN
ncbi:MAG: hypothetical protein FD167_886 [bacterium]|nr:MAG: hypothetical protein FD167_886 [bacterium]